MRIKTREDTLRRYGQKVRIEIAGDFISNVSIFNNDLYINKIISILMSLDIKTVAVDYDLFVNILQGKVFKDLVNIAEDKSRATLLNKVDIIPESLPLIPDTNFNRAVYIVDEENEEEIYYPLVTFIYAN